MGKERDKIVLTQTVAAPPKAVYYAFTNEAAIQGWLCDNAQVDARENGRVYLHWNRGYYACGEFTALDNVSLKVPAGSFRYQKKFEPA